MDAVIAWGLKLLDGLIWMLFALFFIWTFGALWFWPSLPMTTRVLLIAAFIAANTIIFRRSPHLRFARSIATITMVLVFAASVILIRPRTDRTWAADQSQVAEVKIFDDDIVIRNFRNSHYRSELDYDVHFETKQFKLSSIETVWLIIQKFTADEGLAHVFLSFGLSNEMDPNFFSVSVEVRREVGEVYHPIRGLFRTYELTHIIGDEKDLIGVRTIHRPNDRVYMYRINATPGQTQELFKKFANRISQLNERPQFYNTFLNNCANGITSLTYELTPEPINWLDSRIVFPGFAAEFGFEKGLIGERDSSQTLGELNEKARIDKLARANLDATDFSKAIRATLNQQSR